MSLRKRQAINADGGNYRNYSKTGIIWSTIDKNSVLAGTTPKSAGRVTGLKFETHSANGTIYAGSAGERATVWISDPSNVAVTVLANPLSDDIRNDTDSADADKSTVSAGARGLVFSTRCKLALSGVQNKGTAMNLQYNIESMGSGYKVGDYVVVLETALGASGGSAASNLVKVTITSIA
jgi:hypothetical protein